MDRFWLVQKDSFYLAVFSGLACRPADINLLVVAFFVPERLQSWLGGLESLVLWLGRFLCCFLLFGQVNVSVFACNATGLDAVQRLEQKK